MPMLRPQDANFLKQQFGQLVDPVTLVFFCQSSLALPTLRGLGGTATSAAELCPQTESMLNEVAALSDKITVEKRNFSLDKEAVAQYQIDKIPAIAIVRGADGERRDYGIRYYGIPAGHEFSSFVADIGNVSSGESGLAPESKQTLATLKRPVHIQVFSTPT